MEHHVVYIESTVKQCQNSHSTHVCKRNPQAYNSTIDKINSSYQKCQRRNFTYASSYFTNEKIKNGNTFRHNPASFYKRKRSRLGYCIDRVLPCGHFNRPRCYKEYSCRQSRVDEIMSQAPKCLLGNCYCENRTDDRNPKRNFRRKVKCQQESCYGGAVIHYCNGLSSYILYYCFSRHGCSN